VVKRTEGSVGINEEEGTTLCPLFSKKSKNFSLNSLEVIRNRN